MGYNRNHGKRKDGQRDERQGRLDCLSGVCLMPSTRWILSGRGTGCEECITKPPRPAKDMFEFLAIWSENTDLSPVSGAK